MIRKMSRIFLSWMLIFWISLFSPRIVFAQFGDFYDKFQDYVGGQVGDKYLKPFAKDLGGLIGGGSFHTGKSCGFPGFDIGIHLPLVSKPSEEDEILIKGLGGDKVYGLPWVQGEIGLPLLSFDAILRASYLGEAGGKLFGGGVKYSLLSGSIPLTPAISFSFLVNSLTHKKLNVLNYGFNGVASWGLPIVTPYAGIGFDNTTVKSKILSKESEATASGWRFIGGINFKLFPLTYFHLGLGLVNNISSYELGLGISF